MNAGQMVAALRDVASTKSLSRDEVNDLLRFEHGKHRALARIHARLALMDSGAETVSVAHLGDGNLHFSVYPTRHDATFHDQVVEAVEDPSSEISLEEARWDDEGFEPGDVMEVPVDFAQFGRNAVMAVKQRIVQRVREGERQRVREEFNDRVGELLSGEVQQIERGKIVVMLNRARDAEAIIPWKEQNPRERFRQGDPIRAVLKKVEETPKGPRLILSRADPLFVAALFKLEVPEIYQGIVEIRELAREVGGRSKIAVSSRDDSIDPVGACVGLKGSRVQAVVSELGGERIDIVPWHPDTEVFARRALAPARVAKVISNTERQVITAIVDEDQLSLAIGRNGQNVRLASQLIGWQIDLYGSREWLEKGADLSLFTNRDEDQLEMADFPLAELDLTETTLASLQAAGYNTFLDIIDLERDDVLRIEGLSEQDADKLLSIIDELTVVDGDAQGDDENQADAQDTTAEASPGEASADSSDEAP